MNTIVYILLFVALAFFGSPLYSIIGGVALLCFSLAGIDTSAVIVELYRLASAPTLIAIPLFTFAGFVLAEVAVFGAAGTNFFTVRNGLTTVMHGPFAGQGAATAPSTPNTSIMTTSKMELCTV